MGAGIALVALAVVGGGLYYASKAKAESDNSSEQVVTGDSGESYIVRDLGRRVVEGQDTAIIEVADMSGNRIMVYQQFVGDQNSRIWDKHAGGLTTSDELWLLAVQDFGVFTSV